MLQTTTPSPLRRLVPAAMCELTTLAGTAAVAEQVCPTLLPTQ